MTAGREDLVLKISADTGGVVRGLAPMSDALDGIAADAAHTDKELKELSSLDVSPDTTGLSRAAAAMDDLSSGMKATRDAARDLSNVDITLDVKEQALTRARQRVDELRTKIAQDVVLGVSTKAAEQELSRLESTIRRLNTPPPVVDIDVQTDEVDDGVAGMEALRGGITETTMALGDLTNGFSGMATIGQAVVPMLADLNETMVDLQARAAASGRSMGALGRATSAVTSVMAGPWGLAVAAGVGLLSVFSMKQDEAEQEIEGLSKAIDFQAGAWDRNNRSQAAQMLETKGLLAEADKLGISTEDLTSAILGNSDALASVKAQAAAASRANSDLQGDVLSLLVGVGDLAVTNKDTAESQARLNAAIGETAEVTGDTADAVEDSESAWSGYNRKVADARSELDGLIASMDIFNGRVATVREATSAYQDNVADMTDALKESGKAAKDSAGMFDLSKDKGREYDAMVRDTAESIASLTEARLADSDGSAKATDAIVSDYGKQRAALVKSAESLGMGHDAAVKYVDQLLKTPKELKSEVKLTGVKSAESDLDKLEKDRHATLVVGLDIESVREAARRAREIAQQHVHIEIPATSPRAAPSVSAPSPTVFLQPRLFLDSAPIRAAMHGDITSAVASVWDATRTPGRL